jgi:microcompartment protein CcmL/EutN
MFMEEVNYKMEIGQPEEETKRVLVRNEEFTEEEKREAFKKKLRKYSGKSKSEDFEQLP